MERDNMKIASVRDSLRQYVLSNTSVRHAIPHVRVADTKTFTAQPQFHKLIGNYLAEFHGEAVSPNWYHCVPHSLRDSVADVLNYLGMVVAIDFRHWGERGDFAPVGARVDGFCGFYATLPPIERDAHAEKDVCGGRVVRGSAAMTHLLKRAVEVHGVEWYRPAYMATFTSMETSTEVLRCCFIGHEEDGVTPMWMPATQERVELLMTLSHTFMREGTTFDAIWRESEGYLYHPVDPKKGFLQRLVQLHPRYSDFARVSVSTGTWILPVLKLAQLTAIAFNEALAHMAHSHTPGPPFISGRAFRDLEQLTVCCDYQIPRGLRALGAIQYDDALATLVDNGVLLQEGGVEETSIRLATLLASELLLDFLQNATVSFSSPFSSCAWDVTTLDHMLWWIGRYHTDPSARHHLCRTNMY